MSSSSDSRALLARRLSGARTGGPLDDGPGTTGTWLVSGDGARVLLNTDDAVEIPVDTWHTLSQRDGLRRRVVEAAGSSFVRHAEPLVRQALVGEIGGLQLSNLMRWRLAVRIADVAVTAADESTIDRPAVRNVERLAALVLLAADSTADGDAVASAWTVQQGEMVARWVAAVNRRDELVAVPAFDPDRVEDDLAVAMRWDPEDRHGLANTADLHLLSRYRVLKLVGAMWRSRPGLLLPAALLLIGAALACVLLVLRGADSLRLVGWCCVGGFGAALGASLLVGPRSLVPLFVRMPLSALVGVFALMAAPAWADRRPSAAMWLLASVTSAGFILVECVQHAAGTASVPRNIGRALLVWGIGTAHALAVAVVATAFVGDAFFGQAWVRISADLDELLPVVATLGAGGLLGGMILQTFWEDMPITAPMAHLSWRTR